MNTDLMDQTCSGYLGRPLASSTLLREGSKSKIIMRPYSYPFIENKYIEHNSIEKGLVGMRINFWEERWNQQMDETMRSKLEKTGEKIEKLKKVYGSCPIGSYCSKESLCSGTSSASGRESSSSGVISMSNSNSDQEEEIDTQWKLYKKKVIMNDINKEPILKGVKSTNKVSDNNNNRQENFNKIDITYAMQSTTKEKNTNQVEKTNGDENTNKVENTNKEEYNDDVNNYHNANYKDEVSKTKEVKCASRVRNSNLMLIKDIIENLLSIIICDEVPALGVQAVDDLILGISPYQQTIRFSRMVVIILREIFIIFALIMVLVLTTRFWIRCLF